MTSRNHFATIGRALLVAAAMALPMSFLVVTDVQAVKLEYANSGKCLATNGVVGADLLPCAGAPDVQFTGYGQIRLSTGYCLDQSRGGANSQLEWTRCGSPNGRDSQTWGTGDAHDRLNNVPGWCAGVSGEMVVAQQCAPKGQPTRSNQRWVVYSGAAAAGIANRAPTLADVQLAIKANGNRLTLAQALEYAARSNGAFGVSDVLRIIGNDGASLIGNDGASFRVMADGRLIGNDGASYHIVNGLISNDGGSLIGNAGGTLISNNTAPLLTNGGANIASTGSANVAPVNPSSLVTDNGSGMRRLTSVSTPCSTKWVDLLLDTARPGAQKTAQECDPAQYIGGAWQRNLTAAEQDRVKAKLADPAFQQVVVALLQQNSAPPQQNVAAAPKGDPCRDAWVSKALRVVITGSESTGNQAFTAQDTGDQGACDYRHYNGGSWNSYAELQDAVVVYRKAFNLPINATILADYNKRHNINANVAAPSSQYQQIGTALGSNFQSLKVVDNAVCLTVGNAAVGQAVTTAACNGSAAQQFRFNGSTIVANVKANGQDLCLDAGAGGEDTVVTVQPCGKGGGQNWSTDGDRVKASSGRVLDPGSGNTVVSVRTAVPGYKAQQWTATGPAVAPVAAATTPAPTPTPAPAAPAVNLASDPRNCGTMGNVCASGAFTNGVCAPVRTTAPAAPAVNLASDPRNCGTMGNVCASGTCTNGVCAPVRTTAPAPVAPAPTPVAMAPAGPNCSNAMLTAALKANGKGTVADTGTSGLCNPNRYRGGGTASNQGEWNDLVKQSFYCQDPWIGEIWAEAEQGYRQLDRAPQLCNIKLYNNGSWSSWSQLRQLIQEYHRKNPSA